jgi:hypothetical protein
MSKDTKKFIVEGTVRFAPNPRSKEALKNQRFPYSDFKEWGFNIPLKVEGQKPSERYTICACKDARGYVNGFVRNEMGSLRQDTSFCLSAGTLVRATAYGDKGFNKSRKKSPKTGKMLTYLNFWVSNIDQIEILKVPDEMPDPDEDEMPDPNERPHG